MGGLSLSLSPVAPFREWIHFDTASDEISRFIDILFMGFYFKLMCNYDDLLRNYNNKKGIRDDV